MGLPAHVSSASLEASDSRFAAHPMLLLGLNHLQSLIDRQVLSLKMVFNVSGAIIFPITRQHRDMKAEGISYEDDYKGNALAALLTPGLIEIRFHKAYSDADVTRLVSTLIARPELSIMNTWRATYQGRAV
jgi:hypothetical protein